MANVTLASKTISGMAHQTLSYYESSCKLLNGKCQPTVAAARPHAMICGVTIVHQACARLRHIG